MRQLAALLLLASSALAQDARAKGVNFYSLEKEQALGQQLVANLESSLLMVDDPVLLAYIAQLGAALTKVADPQFTYTFKIYEDRRLPAGKGNAASPVMPADALASPPPVNR
jgi:predicted Zn-dependent protease